MYALSAEIYEIAACVQLGPILDCDLEIRIARLPSESVHHSHEMPKDMEGMCLELHLDPEDTIRYTAVLAGRQSSSEACREEREKYVSGERSFCRTRFSSFVILRLDERRDGDNVKVCIHCGEDLRSA